MPSNGLHIKKSVLLPRLNSSLIEAQYQLDAAKAQWHAENEERRKELAWKAADALDNLQNHRRAALVIDWDPEPDLSRGGRFYVFDETRNAAALTNRIQSLEKAIELISLAEDDIIHLGPKMIGDLNILEYL